MSTTDEQVRLLADDGTLLEHDTYKVNLSDDELRDLYVQLVVVRRIDTEGTNLQRQGQLGIWAPCLGQEAAQVGSASALGPDDFVFPSYREHGVAYVRGVDVVPVLAYGPMVKVALDAAQAAEEEGLGELEVIDLRSIVPLDEDTLVASARKTGRMVVVHEAPEFLGMGAEVATRVTEAAFLHLEAPVLRCAGLDIPYPPARLEEVHLPSVDRILWTVQRTFGS